MRSKIEEFMAQRFYLEFNDEITEDTDLFKAGVIDSSGYIQLVKFIEKEFHIRFTEDELLSNVLVTFSSMVDFVSRKLNSQ